MPHRPGIRYAAPSSSRLSQTCQSGPWLTLVCKQLACRGLVCTGSAGKGLGQGCGAFGVGLWLFITLPANTRVLGALNTLCLGVVCTCIVSRCFLGTRSRVDLQSAPQVSGLLARSGTPVFFSRARSGGSSALTGTDGWASPVCAATTGAPSLHRVLPTVKCVFMSGLAGPRRGHSRPGSLHLRCGRSTRVGRHHLWLNSAALCRFNHSRKREVGRPGRSRELIAGLRL